MRRSRPQELEQPEVQVPAHALDSAAVAELQQADAGEGLDQSEALARLARFGPNKLRPSPPTPLVLRFFRQLRDPMALLLLAAATVAAVALNEVIDAAAIGAIVLLNASIALIQEGRAARALEALRSLESPEARVRRSGGIRIVPAEEIVPGDVVVLATGDRVPADLRLVESSTLEVDESLLSGESLPVIKRADEVTDADAPLQDRLNSVFTGSHVTRGSAVGIAVATGERTELGKIAARLREKQPVTPLQDELAHLSSRLGTVAIFIAGAVFGLTLVVRAGTDLRIEQAFLSAVALAVAAVPEGLATVVTVGLALGVRRMVDEGAIVRHLPAVETLGSTTVIATDKTGTLTENRMRVETVKEVSGASVKVETDAPVARWFRFVAVLCNDASLDPPAGDPLEIALLEAAGREATEELRRRFPRIRSTPFDSDRKRMSTLHQLPDGPVLLVKGSPESVIERSGAVLLGDGSLSDLNAEFRDRMLTGASDMASHGMRVLAFAFKHLPDSPQDLESEEQALVLVSLAALRDPVRAEAPGAVQQAMQAGVRVIMVTGDHPRTALSIGAMAGVASEGAPVLTGPDLRSEGLPENPTSVPIYARISPDDKLDLVRRLQARDEVVAVTGDGVNDAPALHRADIGVAMGRSGTDVAREASDMIVTDDNLATIVTAIRQGRGIYDNIRKVVEYLVAANLSEIVVVVAALLLFPDLGVPLLPLQLLWINLVTDGMPALALGVDPITDAVMSRPPRRKAERLLNLKMLKRLSARGTVIAVACLGAFAIARYWKGESWHDARALLFTTLAISQLLYVFAVRMRDPSSQSVATLVSSLMSNRWLLAAVGLGIAMQMTVVYWPPARTLFDTAPLNGDDWLVVGTAAALPAILIAAVQNYRIRADGTKAA